MSNLGKKLIAAAKEGVIIAPFQAEIDRLGAVCEAQLHGLEWREKELTRLAAESARLQGVVTSYVLTERELKTERDRLRAALEIANMYRIHFEEKDRAVIKAALSNEKKP